MPLEGDVSIVLIIQVLLLIDWTWAPHHGDEPRRLHTLTAVRRLARVPSSDGLQQSPQESTYMYLVYTYYIIKCHYY